MTDTIIDIADQPNNPDEGTLENEPNNPREGAPENEPNNPGEGAPENDPNNPREGAPENELAIMAMLKMALNGLGKLGHMWVMMALQGGFVFTVQTKDCVFITALLFLKDCVFITVMLFLRGIRILCGNPDHNIQQLALYCIQLVSAITTGVLSAMQLYSQDFGQTEEAYKNRNFFLNVFYGIAFAETLLLLVWCYLLRRPFMEGENVN